MKKEKIYKISVEKFLAYNLHCGKSEFSLDYTLKPYLQGNYQGSCIFDVLHTRFYFCHSLRFLKKLFSQRKKILFIGSPIGLEKKFASMCLRKKHFWLETWPDGLFTNSEWFLNSKKKSILKIEERPSLIFIFDLSLSKKAKEEVLRLEIPIMAFVNSDENIENIDYPIPANIKTSRGGLFLYNLFFHFFNLY